MTQVWSASHINSNLTGGGTTTVSLTTGASLDYPAYGSEGFTTGKKYWETEATSTVIGNIGQGIGNTASSTANGQWVGYGTDTLQMSLESGAFALWWNGHSSGFAQWTDSSVTTASGDRIAHALDLVNNLYWANDLTAGTGWRGVDASSVGDPANGTNGFNLARSGATILNSPVVPAISEYTSNDSVTGYFASNTWNGTAPSGFGPFDPAGLPTGLIFDQPLPKAPFQFNRTYVFPYAMQLMRGQDSLGPINVGGVSGRRGTARQMDWPLPKTPPYPVVLRTEKDIFRRLTQGQDQLGIGVNQASQRGPVFQTNWPLPKAPFQSSRAYVFPYALATMPGQDLLPKNQSDWPLPKAAKPGRTRDLDTWLAWYSLNLIGLDRLPSNQSDWPDPKAPFQFGRGFSLWYPPGLVGLDLLPFSQSSWPLPQRPKPGRPADIDTQTVSYNVNLIGLDALPFVQSNWPLSRVPRPGRTPDLDVWGTLWNVPLLGLPALPSNQLDWPLPRGALQFGRGFSVTYPPALVGQDLLPFAQADWPVPERRVKPGRAADLDTWGTLWNLPLLGMVALPSNQFDWPIPRVSSQFGRGFNLWLPPGLIGQDLLPFSQQDWPLPQRPRPGRGRDLDTQVLWYPPGLIGQDTLPQNQDDWPLPRTTFQFSRNFVAVYPPGLFGLDQLPNRQQDWPLPKAAKPNRPRDLDSWLAWYNQNLIALDALPFGQADWPLPKTPPQFNRGSVLWYPPPLIGGDILPFSQLYWPLPQRQLRRALNLDTQTVGYILSLLGVDNLPIRQQNWPLPQRAKPGRVRELDSQTSGYILSLLGLDALPARQQNWPLSRLLPPRIDIILPNGLILRITGRRVQVLLMA